MTAVDQNGVDLDQARAESFPIGTVEQILQRAPADAVERLIEVPEWECSIKLRSASAKTAAEMKGASIAVDAQKGEVGVNLAAMERVQFLNGVIEPKFTVKQVEQLQATSSRGFQRVIKALDDLSPDLDKEVAKAKAAFQPDAS